MGKRLTVDELRITKASYYRTPNPVTGAGAVAHGDGIALVTDGKGRSVRLRFATVFDPATGIFTADIKAPTGWDVSGIRADVLHNAAAEYVRQEIRKQASGTQMP